MKKIPRISTIFLLACAFFLLTVLPAQALPTFQVYIDGATAGDIGSDEDTWFSYVDPFTLVVVGAYTDVTASINNVTLVICVPEGETGTISITDLGDGVPTLLTDGADTDTLTNVGGLDGYLTKIDFLPTGISFNEHYPFKDDVSDFLTYDLGIFEGNETNLNNYDAETGTIEATTTSGEQQEYQVSWTGFSSLHFDVYGLIDGETWKINPPSHDAATAVPEPATMLLLGSGLIGLAAVGRKKFFKKS